MGIDAPERDGAGERRDGRCGDGWIGIDVKVSAVVGESGTGQSTGVRSGTSLTQNTDGSLVKSICWMKTREGLRRRKAGGVGRGRGESN